MISSYILILCFSAWLSAYLLLRVNARFCAVVGPRAAVPPGVIALVSALAFLIVVAAPASMIVGALILTIAQIVALRHEIAAPARWAIYLLASAFAAASISFPTLAGIQPLALQALAGVVLLGISIAATRLPESLSASSLCLLVPTLPLLVAPLLGAPSYVAIDVALIASALLGAAYATKIRGSIGLARQPFALILGWLVLETAARGAWIAAALSLLLYAGAFAYALVHEPSDEAHAF